MRFSDLIIDFIGRKRRSYALAAAMLASISVLTVSVPRRVGKIVDALVTHRLDQATLIHELAWLVAIGVAIYFFLLVHILDTALVRVSPEAYNAVINQYKTPLMGLGEIGLVAAIGLHALNGLRIILIDFWSVGTKHQKLMFYIVIGLWVVLMIGFVPRQLMHIFGGGE